MTGVPSGGDPSSGAGSNSAGSSGAGGRGAARWWLPLLLVVLGVVVARDSTWTQLARTAEGRVISDFQILWAAGQGLAEGRDIHDPAALDAVGRRVGRPATPFCAYNPLVVRAFGLSGSDFHRAFARWQAVNVGLIAFAVVLLALALGRAGLGLPGPAALALAAAAVLFDDSTWTNLFWNQMNAVALVALLGALLAGLRADDRRGSWLEGVLLAVAVAAKTSPALLLVIALATGRRRTVIGGVLAGLALFELSVLWSGWAVHDSYVRNVLPLLGYAPEVQPGLGFANNMSATNLAPHGLISRAMFRAGDMTSLAAATWAVTAVVLAVAAVALARGRGGHGAPPAERRRVLFGHYALGVGAIFLTSSVTWPHHLLWLALPVAWLAADAWRGRGGVAGTLLAGAAVLVLYLPMYTFAPGSGRGADMTGVTPLGEEQDMRVRTAALALLFLVTAARVGAGAARRPEGPAAGPQGAGAAPHS